MSSCLFFSSYVAMQIDSQQIVTRKYILNVLQNVSSKALIFYIDTQSSEKNSERTVCSLILSSTKFSCALNYFFKVFHTKLKNFWHCTEVGSVLST